MPNADIVRSIYSAIVEGHVAGQGLDESVARLAPKLVDATIELHRGVRSQQAVIFCTPLQIAEVCIIPVASHAWLILSRPAHHLHMPQVMHNFLPSAVKFHYQFNLREMSNIVGGLCRMTKDAYKDPVRVRDGGRGTGDGITLAAGLFCLLQQGSASHITVCPLAAGMQQASTTEPGRLSIPISRPRHVIGRAPVDPRVRARVP